LQPNRLAGKQSNVNFVTSHKVPDDSKLVVYSLLLQLARSHKLSAVLEILLKQENITHEQGSVPIR
jgi:hypothetical protein